MARPIELHALCASLLALLAAWPVAAAAPATLTGETMGTIWSVKIVLSPNAKLDTRELRSAIQSRLDGLEAAMSTYRADSEVSRFNRATTTNWFPVSTDTAQVVTEALRVNRATAGAFDITVAPLVELWGFGRARSNRVPASNEISAALAHTGSEKLFVRAAPPALRKADPRLAIDLSGIAKGYAVDALSELLARKEITNHLAQIGGEFLARGHATDGGAWRVGIEDATRPGEILRAVELKDQALSTSGNYRNVHEVAGRKFGHILDPRTGWPVESGLASVSIIATSSATADALATALFVLGPAQAATTAERLGVRCFLDFTSED